MAFLALRASAAPCPATDATPCRPDEATKQRLLAALDEVVHKRSDYFSAYIAWQEVKAGANKELELTRFEAYLKVHSVFENAASHAIDLIQTAYNVAPPKLTGNVRKSPTPTTTLDWMNGLSAQWRPRISLNNDEYREITAVDGSKHYIAVNSIEDAGFTLPNGDVIIRFLSVVDAHMKKNPGVIAEILYHEGRHFDRLITEGWSYREIDEFLAYSDAIAHHDAFELDEGTAEVAKTNLLLNQEAIKSGQLTQISDSTENAKEIKKALDQLAAFAAETARYYEKLKNDVDGVRRETEARLEEERRTREKEKLEREDQERRARLEEERPERERTESERKKQAFRKEMDAEAAICGYRIRYAADNETMIGFTGSHGHYESYSLGRDYAPFDFGDLKVVFLMARVCDDIEHAPKEPAPPACNGAASLLHERVSRGDFVPKLKYLTMYPITGYSPLDNASGCIKELLNNADKITDANTFNSIIASYQKRLIKRLDKEAKQNAKLETERKEREHEKNSDGGRSRPPEGGGKDYRWDPSCNCWIREQ